MIGQKLGIYEIVEKLGEGGMGCVYKAHDESLDRFVAIKLLSPRLSFGESFLARFDQEAKSIAKVRHPNLIHIYAVGKEGSYNYFAMEYLEGETLANIIKKRGHIKLNTSVKIVGQVMAALNEVHRAGIVHRDIKPANIMIDKNGRVVLMDFGLAKLGFGGVGESTQGITTDGELLGTPEYMSPEQVQCEKVDARSDIYSLGIVLYEMLCGSTPFHGKSAIAILHQHLESEPPPLKLPAVQVGERAPNSNTLGLVEFVIRKAMAKSPDDRYQNLAEMAIDLSGVCRTSALVLLARGIKKGQRTVKPAASSSTKTPGSVQNKSVPPNSTPPAPAGVNISREAKRGRKAIYVAAVLIIIIFSLGALARWRQNRQRLGSDISASPSIPSSLEITPRIKIVPKDNESEVVEGKLSRIKVNSDGTLEIFFGNKKRVLMKGTDVKEIINLSAANQEK